MNCTAASGTTGPGAPGAVNSTSTYISIRKFSPGFVTSMRAWAVRVVESTCGWMYVTRPVHARPGYAGAAMLAAEPTRTDAKSFSLTLAMIHTVERSTTVKSSWAVLTTKPRFALRVRTTPLIG